MFLPKLDRKVISPFFQGVAISQNLDFLLKLTGRWTIIIWVSFQHLGQKPIIFAVSEKNDLATKFQILTENFRSLKK